MFTASAIDSVVERGDKVVIFLTTAKNISGHLIDYNDSVLTVSSIEGREVHYHNVSLEDIDVITKCVPTIKSKITSALKVADKKVTKIK